MLLISIEKTTTVYFSNVPISSRHPVLFFASCFSGRMFEESYVVAGWKVMA